VTPQPDGGVRTLAIAATRSWFQSLQCMFASRMRAGDRPTGILANLDRGRTTARALSERSKQHSVVRDTGPRTDSARAPGVFDWPLFTGRIRLRFAQPAEEACVLTEHTSTSSRARRRSFIANETRDPAKNLPKARE
jgi:hypothetical protein